MMFGEPLVHMSKHVAAGMIQLRWRMPGTQKYLELNRDVSEVMTLVGQSEESNGDYDIFYFEAKRLSLNTDYGLFFNARKRYRKSKELAKEALWLKQRSRTKNKNV